MVAAMSKITQHCEQNARPLQDIFDELNATLFDGVLPRRYVLYRIRNAKHKGRHWGDPVYDPYKIVVRAGLDREEERRVMIHEMCHYFGYHAHECAAGIGWAAAMRECHARGEIWIGQQLWRWHVADYYVSHDLPDIADEIIKMLQTFILLDGRVPCYVTGDKVTSHVLERWWIGPDQFDEEKRARVVRFASILIGLCNRHNPIVQAEVKRAKRWAWLRRLWEVIKHGV